MKLDIKELRTVVEAAGLNAISAQEVLELIDRLEAAEQDALEQARLNGMGAERELALMVRVEAAERNLGCCRAEREEAASLFLSVKAKLIGERDALRVENEALQAKLEASEKSDAESIAMYRKARDERDALKTKIEQMEQQEPYSYIYEYANPIDGSPVWRNVPGYWNAQFPKSSKALYALPGAEPVVTPKMEQAFYEKVEVTAIGSIRGLADGIKAAMLAAAPEAKS